MFKILRKIYMRLGIHTAPPGTLFYALNYKLYEIVRRLKPPHNHFLISEGEFLNAKNADFSPGVAVQRNRLHHLPIRSVAIVKGDHIGDLVVAIPAIDLLKIRFPAASITLICSPWNETFAQAMGLFDKVVVVPLESDAGKGITPHDIAKTIRILDELPPFDIAIDLKKETSTRYALQHIKARLKAGFYADKMPQENSIILPPVPHLDQRFMCNMHIREMLCMLVNAVITRIDFEEKDAASNVLRVMAREGANKNMQKTRARPVIGINTGAGQETKCWPIERFAALCRGLQDHLGAHIILFGSKKEMADAKKIILQCDPERIENLAGKLSLAEFTAFLPALDLYIGHDTGSTHIAAAVGGQTLCVHSGMGNINWWAPKGDKVTIIRHDVHCSPCEVGEIKHCPDGHICMEGISVSDVAGTVMRILGSKSAPLSAPLPGQEPEIRQERA